MKNKIPVPIQVMQEKDSKGKKIYVAVSPVFPAGGQGRTYEKAVNECKNAIELYLGDKDVKISKFSMSFSMATIPVKVPQRISKTMRA